MVKDVRSPHVFVFVCLLFCSRFEFVVCRCLQVFIIWRATCRALFSICLLIVLSLCGTVQYMEGKLKVDEFITHHFPLDQINDAFEVMHAGKRSLSLFLSLSLSLLLSLCVCLPVMYWFLPRGCAGPQTCCSAGRGAIAERHAPCAGSPARGRYQAQAVRQSEHCPSVYRS